jgi:hypothetical protein
MNGLIVPCGNICVSPPRRTEIEAPNNAVTHYPIAEQHIASEALATIISDEVAQYGVDGKGQVLISDTKNAMPRTPVKLQIECVPSLAHVLNLILVDVTTTLKAEIQPLLVAVRPYPDRRVLRSF